MNKPIPEEWKETVDYIKSVIPTELHIHEIRVIENIPKLKPSDPSYYIEFDLVNQDAKNPYTITRQFNALKARRHVEQLKKKENLN